jgi:hypothetical protein
MSDIVSIFYPENGAGGFSRCDGTVNSINGFTLCCVQTTLYLILAPAVARPIIKILRFIGKASGTCEAKEGASSA